MNLLKTIAFLLLIALSFQCQPEKTTATAAAKPADPHSFAQPEIAVTKHLDLNLKVNFDQKILSGYARWTISAQDKARKSSSTPATSTFKKSPWVRQKKKRPGRLRRRTRSTEVPCG